MSHPRNTTLGNTLSILKQRKSFFIIVICMYKFEYIKYYNLSQGNNNRNNKKKQIKFQLKFQLTFDS